MDTIVPGADDPETFITRFYDRLKAIPDIEWDETFSPVHSSYDDWIALGYRTNFSSSSPRSTPASSLHASSPTTQSAIGSPRLNHDRTRSGSTTLGSSISSIASSTSITSSASSTTSSSGITVMRSPDSSQPSRQMIAVRVSRHILRLEREYQIIDSLLQTADPEGKHIIKPIFALRLRPRFAAEPPLFAVVVESPGMNNLADRISFGPNFYNIKQMNQRRDSMSHEMNAFGTHQAEPMGLTDFLDVAIGACECLEVIHQGNRIVHGELRADSFHWNQNTGRVRLTNFGSGVRSFENGLTSAGWSTLSRERGVEYKLQFIAPEQTGRLPAAPDSRTDIYSLGIVFWVMLTNDRPFPGSTPLEIMQSVLVRRVPPVSSRRLDVLDAVSAVIQKMVQRNIEDRYHSATGLKHDLSEIQRLLCEGDTAALTDFKVGARDVNCFFNLPDMQVGRDDETETALDIIERVAQRRVRSGTSSLRVRQALSSNSSRSGDPSTASVHEDETASAGGSGHSGASPASIVPLSRFNTNQRSLESRDSIPEIDTLSNQNSSYPSFSLDSRLSMDNTNSTGSDFGTRISGIGGTDGNGIALRNRRKYKRKNKTEVITISGVAGLGKSRVVHTIQGFARKYGYFASAKFDQMRQAPFAAVLKVMSSLFRQVFSETNVSTEFHNNLRSFVRPVWGSLHVMLDLPSWLLDSANGVSQASSKSVANGQKPDKSSAHTKHKKGLTCTRAGHTAADFLLSGSSTKSSRFVAIFLDVLRFLASNTLVLFCLDDLQFADDESLSLIQSVLSAKIPLVLIATYREKYLLPQKVITLLDSDAANVTVIELLPLLETHVAEYVAATLQRTPDYVLPLVAVIQEKTLGNPFFMREMLEQCYRQHCIRYSWTENAWMYDLDRVFDLFESEEYGSSISNDYVVKRLNDLSSNTRSFIAWASLLGSSFSFRMVKMLMSGDAQHHHHSVADGKAQLVRQSSRDAVQGLQGAVTAYIVMAGEDDDQFRFCHDRYVQAAEGLEERKDSAQMHFQIAQAMMHYLADDDTTLYAKAFHICDAIDLIKAQVPFRAAYRDVLFRAAERSTESEGPVAGLNYFKQALALLQDEPWDETNPDVNYQETLSLYTRAAGAYLVQGYEEESLVLLRQMFTNARNAPDRAPSWILKSRVYARRTDYVASFNAIKDGLAELGLPIPELSWEQCDARFLELAGELQNMDVHTLLDRPLTTCTKYTALSSLLCEIMGMAYWHSPLLYYNMALVEVDLNLHRGEVRQAGLAFCHLATIAISRFDMVQFGIEMGELGLRYFDKYSNDFYVNGRGRAIHSILVAHVSTHIRNTIPGLEASTEASLMAGDKFSALLSMSSTASARLAASHDLVDIEAYCAYSAEEIFNWENDYRGGVHMTAVRQYCRALQGKTSVHLPNGVFNDETHNTEEYLKAVQTRSIHQLRSRMTYANFYIPALYLYGHYEEAVRFDKELLAVKGHNWSNSSVLTNSFYIALCYVALLRDDPDRADKTEIIQRAESARDKIVAWSAVSDVNYFCWSSILEAELAEISGRHDEAMRQYEAALDHADVHGFIYEQALAFELYGEAGIRRGAKRPARQLLLDSMTAYRRISAFGKAQQITERHEWLLHGTSSLGAVDASCQTVDLFEHHNLDGTGIDLHADTHASVRPAEADLSHVKSKLDGHGLEAVGLDMIDLTNILQSSQMLSSELQLDSLLKKMTSIMLESTGADLCAIVTEDEALGWKVGAVADADPEEREYPIGQALDSIEDLVGKQVTLYCLRFQETVFLHNVFEDDRFSNVPDSYRKSFPEGQAIIACPIQHGDDTLLGCVYVQGAPHSFTERNLTLLRLLINSISISITNARLFNRVEKVSASNLVMIESQKQALAQARKAEIAAKKAEAEAIRNMKLKEEAARAKSMFLANISHELRTPLNGVLGMSELLKDTKLNADQKEIADSIRVCADTLLTLINDILDFSKLEAGKMQIFSVPLRLTETIGEVVRALTYANTEKNLETIMQLTIPNEPLVMGDPVRLHQILMNLLSNAYKFTSHGSVTVKATVDREDAQTITMTCSVIDTGLGISDEQKKKLFLPFSQADSSTARSYGGTGLGLSICKAIIENVMKGKIWLESKPGVGTNVSFSLQFQKAPAAPADGVEATNERRDPMAIFTPPLEGHESAPLFPVSNLTSIPREQLRICIAEDNPINQRIAISFVKKIGFQCEAFGDGRQAVTALERASAAGDPFHVVLMDVQMPVLDGYDATREIRAHSDKHVKEVLVIAMTASAIRGDREKCLDAGMNDYLAKPVRAQVLRTMLEGYWKQDEEFLASRHVEAAVDDELKSLALRPNANGDAKSKINGDAANGEATKRPKLKGQNGAASVVVQPNGVDKEP